MSRPNVQTRAARAQVLEDGAMRCTLATESPVPMLDWERFEEVDEVLRADGAEFPEKVPMLDSHNRKRCGDVLGHMIPSREGSAIAARMVWDLDDPEAKRIAGKYERGHMTDVSVGYRVLEATYIEPGKSAKVGGREHKAGARAMKVATRWVIREGSPTPIGADHNAKVRQEWEQARSEHLAQQRSEDAMSDPKAGAKPEQSAPDRGVAEKRAEDSAAEKVIDLNAIRDQAIKDDLKRQQEIADLGQSAGIDAALVQRAIHERWNVDQAAREFLGSLRKVESKPIATAPEVMIRAEQSKEQKIAALAAGLRSQVGALTIRKGRDAGKVWVHPKDRLNATTRAAADRAAEEGQRYRNLAAVDYLAEMYEATTGKRAPRSRSALLDATRAAVSSFDFANVFTTTFEAQLVMAFEEAPDTTDGWVRKVEVPNFNTNERPRSGQLDALEKLAKGDTAKHAGTSDIVESYKAHRYAKQAAFDEQDIINDRLGALMDIPRRLGVAAARVCPDLVYYILANGETAGLAAGALFSSGNSNLGTSGALAAATLQDGIEAMLIQQEDGVNLNLMPRFLIVPVSLLHTARQLVESTTLIGYGGGTNTVSGDKNVLFGTLEVRADARLDNGVTDPASGSTSTGDAAAWYLAADPMTQPTIEVGFVRDTGMVPVVRSYQLERGQWGIGWDVKYDVGAKALAYQGLYKAND